MEKLKDDNTFLMHGWIPKKLKLKGNELIIYSIIYSFSIKSSQGYFNGSTAYLQEWTNTSQRNVINCLKSLIKKNLIICVKDNSKIRKPNIYKANLDILSNILATEKSSVVNNITTEKNSVALLKKVQQTTEKSSVNKNIYKNNNKNIYIYADASVIYSKKEDDTSNTKKEADSNISTSEKKKNTSSKKKQEEKYLQMFNEFWQLYPKKRAKANALKIWLKLKPSDELFKQILSAVKTQSNSEDWLKEKGKYIPYPTTWLNGERWEDEIKEAAGNSQPQETEPCKKPYYQEPFATF